MPSPIIPTPASVLPGTFAQSSQLMAVRTVSRETQIARRLSAQDLDCVQGQMSASSLSTVRRLVLTHVSRLMDAGGIHMMLQ